MFLLVCLLTSICVTLALLVVKLFKHVMHVYHVNGGFLKKCKSKLKVCICHAKYIHFQKFTM